MESNLEHSDAPKMQGRDVLQTDAIQTSSGQSLANQLMDTAQACGIIDIDPSRYKLLARYCEALWDWNTKINLTRHTTPELFVHRDWLDTVRLAAQLKPNERVLDFGSGSGVPGLTLAIIRPDLKVTLCDSVQKKAKVLEDICTQLKLDIAVYPINVKDVLEKESFDTLTARAVGSITKMLSWLKPYWNRFDRLLTIKGPTWVDERGEARHVGALASIQLRKLDEYAVPGHDSASVVLQLCRGKSEPG